MKKKILFYQSTLSPEVIVPLFDNIKNNNFQCIIANSKNVIIEKINDIGILVYKGTNKSEILSMFPKGHDDILICTPEELNKTITHFKENEVKVCKLYKDLSIFFEYINMPPLNTSFILLKETLLLIQTRNLHNCNYSILLSASNNLGLNWKHEQFFMRKNIKDWQKNNIHQIKQIYPTLDLCSKKLLHFLTNLNFAYLQFKHTHHDSVEIILRDKILILAKKDKEILMNAFKQISSTTA